jgi:cell division protein FtsI (penicillin-binding protein 3)
MLENSRPFNQKRFAALFAFFLVWGLVVAGRLVQFQIVLHGELPKPAKNPYKVNKPIPVSRGSIYDSQMVQLATSITVKTVIANPAGIKDIPAAARGLAPLLEMDPNVLMKRLRDPVSRNYLVLKRRIDPNLEPRIQALGIEGIRLEDASLRVYPNGDLAGHPLGFVNGAGIGVAGLERFYNGELTGNRGMAVFEQDARGRSYSEKTIQPPVPAHSLVLSLDNSIQRIVQSELFSGVQRAHAAAGMAIVMESETGRILALANVPGFNPNTPAQCGEKALRNRAIQDRNEAGSTVKVIVASACLDAGLVRPGELIDCRPRSLRIAGHVIHDHKDFGFLEFEQTLEQSSNTGAARLGLRLGEERLEKALRLFGIGSRTGIDLWGEANGRLREHKKWSKLSIASISFGQEVTVTSIQILTAINVIATGGYKVLPTLVDRILNQNGEPIRIAAPKRVRIIRPETAVVIMDALEGVILRGTGLGAALDGYRAAGKTATAQKAEGKRLSKTKYSATFVGFAPLPKPRVTILVQIDEPRGAIYGGDVAAPVFRKIAQEALLILKVPQDRNLLLDKAPTR